MSTADLKKGFFTTFRVHNQKPLWLEEHLDRISLFAVLSHLKVDRNNLQKELLQFLREKPADGRGRIIFDFDKRSFGFSFDTVPQKQKNLKVGIKEISKPLGQIKLWPFNNLGFSKGEELILVEKSTGNVLEGNYTNLFLYKGNRFLTPPADGKIVNGICRQKFIKYLKLRKIETEECYFSASLLPKGEIYLTNSLRGVIKVKL